MAFEKYKPRGLFSEFYGMFMKSSTSGSVKFVWMSLDRPTRSIRTSASGTYVDLHMQRTEWTN